jgi:O-antigen/teichoic acid export membrane protein
MSAARRLLQLGKESAVYGLSGIITRSITIFLVPIYTRVFTPSDYGIIAIIASVTAIASTFLGLGAEAGVGAYFYDSEDQKYRGDLLYNYLVLQVVTGALLTVVLWGLSPWLAETFLGSSEGVIYFRMAAASMLFGAIGSVIFNVFRLLRRPWTLMLYSLANAIAGVVMSIVLVVGFKYGLWGNYLAGLVVAAVFSLVALWLVREAVRTGSVSLKVIRSLVKIGLPYIPTGLALILMAFMGRFLLEHFHSLNEVGLFSIATSLAGGIGLITGAFQMAVGPYALSIQHQPEARSTYADILTQVLVGGMGLAVAASVFAREILQVLTSEMYLGAAAAVPFLAANVIAVSVSYVASLGCWIGKRTQSLAWTTAAGSLTSIAVGFLLVPRFGILGASAAVLMGQCIYVALLFWAAQRVYRIPYRWREIPAVAGVSVVVILLGFQVTADSFLLSVALKSLVVGLFPLGMLVTGVVTFGQLRRGLRGLGSIRGHGRSIRQSPSIP